MQAEIHIMRVGIGLLVVLFMLLQIRLWASDDGFREVSQLSTMIDKQAADNVRLSQRNQRLEAEVVELRKGKGAVEERARADLGLIGPNETFYLFGGERPAG
ncbi:MAG: septum formation initiator family protein [Gammaproteobacteria bacterium]